jgi:hypothetical protein
MSKTVFSILEELPDDIDDSEKYVPIPGKSELDLGKPLVLDFARQFLSDDFDEVRQIFNKRGAYARFKDLLDRRGALDRFSISFIVISRRSRIACGSTSTRWKGP